MGNGTGFHCLHYYQLVGQNLKYQPDLERKIYLLKGPFGWRFLVGRGGEGRGYFNFFFCLVQFLGGEGRDGEGSKIPHMLIYCFPSNWSFLVGRGGKLFKILLHYQNYPQIILKFQEYPYHNFYYQVIYHCYFLPVTTLPTLLLFYCRCRCFRTLRCEYCLLIFVR